MPIPQAALNGGDIVIAVRAAIGEASRGEVYQGGISKAAIGPSKLLHEEATLDFFEDLSSNGYRLVLEAITIFILMALVFALPRQYEYLTLALAFLFAAANNVAHILTGTSFELLSSVPVQLIVEDFFGLGTILFFLEFVNLALGKTRVRWIRLIQASVVVSIWLGSTLTIAIISRRVTPTPALDAISSVLQLLTWLPLDLLLPGILFWEWKHRRNNDAGLLLVPALLLEHRRYLRAGWQSPVTSPRCLRLHGDDADGHLARKLGRGQRCRPQPGAPVLPHPARRPDGTRRRPLCLRG